MRVLKSTIVILSFLTFGISGTAFAQFTGTGSNSNVEYVEGYTKSNGTYVEGYHRTEANSYNLDNFSAKGNYNSYTGEYGTVEYDSPYNSYNSSSTSVSTSSFYESDFSSDVSFDTDYSSSYDTSYDYNYDSYYDY